MRSRALSTMLVAAIALALAPAVLADSEDVTSDQLCETIPSDWGFALQPDIFPPNPSCDGTVGDCGLPMQGWQTCVSVGVFQLPSVDEAVATLRPTQAWADTSGWGEQATVYACDEFFHCGLKFQRGRFSVSILSADPLGMGTAEALASHIDARLIDLVGGDGTSAGPGGSASTTTTTTQPPEAGAAAAGVLFGTDRVPALFPGIGHVLDCDPALLDAEGIIACTGDARSTLIGLDAAFTGAFPDPTNRQLEGASTYGTAVVLANLTGTDGKPLFPSVQGALPLLERLPDPALAERFLEMLAGNDAAQWEDRGL